MSAGGMTVRETKAKAVLGAVAGFFKRETVLGVALVLAAVSACFVPPGPRVHELRGLGHPGPALRPDGGGQGISGGGGLPVFGQPAAAPHWLHQDHAAGAGVSALFLQHAHHQRRVPHHLCALWPGGAAAGGARAVGDPPGGAADPGRQPGEHAHPPWATPRTCTCTPGTPWALGSCAGPWPPTWPSLALCCWGPPCCRRPPPSPRWRSPPSWAAPSALPCAAWGLSCACWGCSPWCRPWRWRRWCWCSCSLPTAPSSGRWTTPCC